MGEVNEWRSQAKNFEESERVETDVSGLLKEELKFK